MADQVERVLEGIERDEETNATLYDQMPQTQRRMTALERAQRDRRIIALAAAGASTHKIAQVMGLKVKIVEKAIDRGITTNLKTPIRDLEKVRELSLQRLDTMLLTIWEKVQEGSLRHMAMALKIEDQRAKLGGLYSEDSKPEQHLHLHGVTTAEIEAATQAWQERIGPGDDTPDGPPEADEPSALEAFAALPDVPVIDAEPVE